MESFLHNCSEHTQRRAPLFLCFVMKNEADRQTLGNSPQPSHWGPFTLQLSAIGLIWIRNKTSGISIPFRQHYSQALMPWEARALEQRAAGLIRPNHFAKENWGRYNSHHCQKGSAQHYWDKGRCEWKHEVSGTGWGWDGKGGVGCLEVWRGERLHCVPKLRASDDRSVHQRGLPGAHWNSSAGRTEKHPPWESAFSPRQTPSDGLAGRSTQCICEEKYSGEGWGGELLGLGQGLSEKHFHFTPRMHWNI